MLHALQYEGAVAERAVLALADGTVFHGSSVGAQGAVAGEVVLLAGIGGREVLAECGNCAQIVALAAPHPERRDGHGSHYEAPCMQGAGLVSREQQALAAAQRGEQDSGAWLRQQGIVAIASVDCRKLARILREHGPQAGVIVTDICSTTGVAALAAEALALARSCAAMPAQERELALHVALAHEMA